MGSINLLAALGAIFMTVIGSVLGWRLKKRSIANLEREDECTTALKQVAVENFNLRKEKISKEVEDDAARGNLGDYLRQYTDNR